MWDPDFAKVHNVAVTRPSHDAWGIKKVVLIFCDDFLQKVYHLPYWHSPTANTGVAGRPTFKSLLSPVLSTLGLPSDARVVRMLLASLPPGVTIPTHHDTGSWVSKSHRVHVPVITEPGEVLFRCGGGAQHEMRRVDCTEGRIFEMNNQAKHAVSNCWSKHRVHLILDYVDDPSIIKTRRLLPPGETLLQTRRSIDVASDYGSTRIPSYLIIGAQKSGTTTLFTYINQHPLAVPGRRRETHFFDWRWPEHIPDVAGQRSHYCKYFQAEELRRHPSIITGESTPSYLLHSTPCIKRVKSVCPWAALIATLRNPVDRAWSHYRMVTSDDGTPAQKKVRGEAWRGRTFAEVVEAELSAPHVKRLLDDDTEEALEAYLETCPMGTGSHSLVARGLYELQLRPWLREFGRDRILIVKVEDMKRGGMQPTMDRVFEHLGLPAFEVKDEGAKNARGGRDDMPKDVKERLEKVYERFDKKLFEV
eukprot:CAMPEP_0182486962 /NCGR_PEP_ID=MMETSP1319-20130603/47662_1 /TAXON_ID=172717 /ORGANISM="Bolidomonas pacifica, Strain RCC208" /LENGTH=475 /DNA_ID=CAMNT_0024689069 /DNA_START=714 /DNA_END=2137 /DNA_ORIENTATION=+